MGSLTHLLDFEEARRKVHIPEDSPTATLGLPEYMRTLSDHSLQKLARGRGFLKEVARKAAETEIQRRQEHL